MTTPTAASPSALDAEYVLPLRRTAGRSGDTAAVADLARYLQELVRHVDVTVVDSSPPELAARHRLTWPAAVRQLPVEPWPGRNGKVAAVVTGVRAARHEYVVMADDDVRYRPAELAAVVARLEHADLVRPQNVFEPLTWHARWDTARTLLNRALGVDHPGTFALRRSTFLAMGGYPGDVLFENLELSRTVRAAGGTELSAPDVYVPRRPPALRQFLLRRVPQAYDDLGQPVRLLAEAALLPSALHLARDGRAGRLGLACAATAVTAVAELGRRRHGGARVFEPTAALWAPAWLTERSVCVWLALGARALGGLRYSDGRIRTAAHPLRWLRRRQRMIGRLPPIASPSEPRPARVARVLGVSALGDPDQVP